MNNFKVNDCPAPSLLRDYLIYLVTIKGRSLRTVEAYYNDLRLYLRFLMSQKDNIPISDEDPNLESIPFYNIREQWILSAKLSDAYSFLAYVQRINNNNSKTRARKVSSIRGFYKYISVKTDLLKENPMEHLETPSLKKSLPKYLTLEESIQLLNSVDGKDKIRDYCILTLLLNCGLRLSELVNIKMKDISDDRLVVLGKGNKERLLYLNPACITAINDYLPVRSLFIKTPNEPYLFISSRTHSPLTPRRVEQLVEEHLKKAGLDGRGFSPHKLRHTAATLMYQYGNVDIRVLKEILGHVNLGTTEIYTHVSNDQIERATDSNPLANQKNSDNS